MIVDINGMGGPEIIVVYDVIVGSDAKMKVEAWSPILSCSVTGWSYGGNKDSQQIWSWEDTDLMISSEEGPYTGSIWEILKPTSQPLLADLDLDGDAEAGYLCSLESLTTLPSYRDLFAFFGVSFDIMEQKVGVRKPWI